MICRIIRDNQGHNPAYDESGDAAIVTLPDGTHPTRDLPEFLTWPVGTLIEHRHAGVLCCYGVANAPPIAEPADDEAKAYFDADMATRPERIERLRELWQSTSRATEFGKHLHNLAIAYGLTDDDDDGDS